MRKFFRWLLFRPIMWFTERFTSAPDRDRIFEALNDLRLKVEEGSKKGFTLPFDANSRFIIFSDQHKGRKNGADDFAGAEENYIRSLQYYLGQNYHLIALGDCEELWENTWLQVRRHNKKSFEVERAFAAKSRFTKIFGNHDLDWDIDPLAPTYLKEIFGMQIVALEAIMLETQVGTHKLKIFCTHGHQGDLQSDGNWFSKFFISKIWAPLQSYIRINPNTPAYDQHLKTVHNRLMYEWSATQKGLLLITGHTHQPVFESLTHLERLNRAQKKALYDHNPQWAEALDLEIAWRKAGDGVRENYLTLKPTYFNTGCCCYADGDITGIEIADGFIRLIKWKLKDGASERTILEEKELAEILRELNADLR